MSKGNFCWITEPDPVNYGQNLHMSFSLQSRNTTDWASVINGKDGWFNEVNYMDCASVVSFKYLATPLHMGNFSNQIT